MLVITGNCNEPPERRCASSHTIYAPVAKPKISLATYTVSIRRKRDSDPVKFGAFDGQRNFIDIVFAYLKALSNKHKNDEEIQSLQRTATLKRSSTEIWGVISSGAYGVAAELVDVNTSQVAYNRLPEHAELMPFYFLLRLPSEAKYGILILQRHGNQGIVTAFLRNLRGYLSQAFPDYVLDVAAHIPGDAVRGITDGELKEIELVYYAIPDDIATKFHLGNNVRKHAYLCQSIKAKRGQSLGKPAWMKAGSPKGGAIFEVAPPWAKDLTEDQEARFKVSYNGNQRTVVMNRPDQLAPYIDITEDVDIDKSGHPKFGSIHSIASNLVADIAAEIGIAE